jgi:drug/metabolite transporter (DMT)-like permease
MAAGFRKEQYLCGNKKYMQTETTSRLRIYAAFAAIYFIWGSTYIASYYAIQDIPAFLMSGIRFSVAGGTLFLFSLLQGKPWPTWIQWKHGIFTGFTFLGISPVAWAVNYIDTGLAALLVSFVPLAVVLLVWLRHGRRPGVGSSIGVLLGIVGMGVLVGQPHIEHTVQTWIAIAAVLFAVLCWAATSVYISAFTLPESRLQTSGVQMLGAGLSLLLFAFLVGEGASFSPAQVSLRAWLSLGYLIFGGSMLAFSSFNYLLSKVPPEQVSTSNYVNPVVALALGWAIKGEKISTQSLLAALLLLSGVFFISSRFVRGRS